MLLFVEEGTPRGFCSESCIEKYYSPLIGHFEQTESELRSQLGCVGEDVIEYRERPESIDRLLSHPDEVWCLRNEMHEEIYSFISKQKADDGTDVYLISLNFVFNKSVSFVFLVTATKSPLLVSEFQIGIPAEVDLSETKAQGNFSVDRDIMLELERKKSQYLAIILVNSIPSDIREDSYHLYASFEEKTISHPDEVYRFIDDDKDVIFSYIASFAHEGTSFFYVVLFWAPGNEVELDLEAGSEAILPITSFPTINGDLVKFFRKGELISGNLRN